jgi:hypothetical protein
MSTPNSISIAERMRFPLSFEFQTLCNENECFHELKALTQRKIGCLNSDMIRIHVNDTQPTFYISVVNRTCTTIEGTGRLSTLPDKTTHVEGQIKLSVFYRNMLFTLTLLALVLLFPIPGSVSGISKLLALGGSILMWYFTLKQRYELRDLIQTTLKGQS